MSKQMRAATASLLALAMSSMRGKSIPEKADAPQETENEKAARSARESICRTKAEAKHKRKADRRIALQDRQKP